MARGAGRRVPNGESSLFTGLIEALGRIERITDEGAGRRLTLAWPGLPDPLAIGESVITITAQNARGGVNTQQKKVVIQ